MRDLLSNQDLVRFALRVARVGVYYQDYVSNEHVWSPLAYEVFGVSEDFEVSAESLLQIIHSDDIPHVLRQVNAAHAVDSAVKEYRIVFRVRGSDGQIRHIEAHAFLERDEEGRLLRERGCVRDISQINLLKQQVFEAQREDILGRVAAGIAHDLNNLLTAVKGHTSLLQYQLNRGLEPDISGLTVIEEAADRAAALTSRLLSLSPRHRSKPGAYDLNESIRRIETMLTRVIEEDRHLTFDYGTEIPPVLMDPVQIEQILLNLLLNARDATQAGDTIVVRTRRERADSPRFLGSQMTPGWAATLEVEDSGEGMSPEVLKHAQDAFFTTKKLGTGLGLSSCRMIAIEHDGSLDIRSEARRGTTVSLILPADPGATPQDCERDCEPEGSLGKGLRVLVAEDDALVRDVAGMGLRGFGFEVVLTRNSDEALAAAEDGPFDIVVSDVVMPRLSAPELRQRFAEKLSGVPVLFVSGYPEGAGKVLKDVLGAGDSFLAKPYTPITLVNKIREMLIRQA